MKILLDLGFDDIKSRSEICFAEHDTVDAYKNYVRGWLPCLFSATTVEYEDFLHDLEIEVMKQFPLQDKLTIPYKKLHLYLRKHIHT